MSQERHQAHPGATGVDKIESHHRQQLSALIDGALAPDEARFLLRRLEHDEELAGCYERWQLCGDVLRGQVRRTADSGFGQRVAAALAAEAALDAAHPVAAAAGRRQRWTRWGGGGAALAASVAMVAMFVGRQQEPLTASESAPLVAEQRVQQASQLESAAPVPTPTPAPVAADAVASADEAGADAQALREVPARASSRPSAVQREPLRAVAVVTPAPAPAATSVATLPAASVASSMPGTDPFASAAPLQARPWPRAVLPQTASGAFNASLGESSSAGATFYPFEPRLPAGTTPSGESSAPADHDAQPH